MITKFVSLFRIIGSFWKLIDYCKMRHFFKISKHLKFGCNISDDYEHITIYIIQRWNLR